MRSCEIDVHAQVRRHQIGNDITDNDDVGPIVAILTVSINNIDSDKNLIPKIVL